MSPLLASLEAGFRSLPSQLLAAGGLAEARRAALAAALTDGLPGARSERWKYTSLRAFERRAFAPAHGFPFEASAIDPALYRDLPAPRLAFVNGRFAPELSELRGLPDGLTIRPLSEALHEDVPRPLDFLARRFEAADETFARLNAALTTDGALVRAEAEYRFDAPIHLLFIGAAAEMDMVWHPRHLVELRENAALTVIEHHLGSGGHRHLSNTLSQVHLRPGARLNHLRIQDECAGASLFARTDAVLAGGSEYRRLDLELGAALSRHELNIALQGVGARTTANGVLLAAGKRHLDTRLAVEHVAGRTESELTWRGLAADGGRAAFHGGIRIRQGADGSAAALSNKNLLLSENAEIDSQPVLEIDAEEVKAAHGATVGQLGETALFYLRSRGLPEAEARALLTAAFCREALADFEAESPNSALTARLDAALARMETNR